jgi:hypothetical protein
LLKLAWLSDGVCLCLSLILEAAKGHGGRGFFNAPPS